MTIEKVREGTELTLRLKGRLDTTTASQLETELKKEYRRYRQSDS